MVSYPSKRRSQLLICLLIISLLALSVVGAASTAASESVKVILQGRSAIEMEQAVQSVGGLVTHRFDLIHAIAADVPATTVDVLRYNGLIVSIDTPVHSAGGRGLPRSAGFT